MFTINVELGKRTSWIEVNGNACGLYCWLARKSEEKISISVQNEVVCVEASVLSLRTSRENVASYEWKLMDLENNVISLIVDDEVDDPDLKTYLNEEDELELSKMVKDKALNGEIRLFSLVEKVGSEKCGDYENSYCMTYDTLRQIFRLEYVSTKQEPYEEGISGSYFNKDITSWMKYFTIDEIIRFDFCNTPFVSMMQKIAAYCDQEHLEYTVTCEEFGVPGHSIDIPCAIVETDRFKVVFDPSGDIKEVHVAKGIMDTSSYVDSQGKTYIIRDVIWQVKSDNVERGFIRGFGAENIWHYFYGEESKYIYGCGFNF